MRLQNPKSIDEGHLCGLIEENRVVPVIQFSERSTYHDELLADVNRACRRFGSRLHVRFYGHYGGAFDCRTLRLLPYVRSLGLDCLMQALHIEELASLDHLDNLTFGVFEAQVPDLLQTSNLKRLRKLILAPTRKNNIDLAPLGEFQELQELGLCGHARHIEVLAGMHSLRRLALNGIQRKVPVLFLSKMRGLRALTLLLGGRTDLAGVTNEYVELLQILRVNGLTGLDLHGFRRIKELQVEDQLQFLRLDVGPVRDSLERLRVLNCKQLHSIDGLELLDKLNHLWISRTKIDAEALMNRLPANLREFGLFGLGSKRDAALKARIQSLGYAEARYTMAQSEFA